MAGTIVVDRLISDASYASSINVASPMVISNTINMTGGSFTGNVNIDSGLLFVDGVNNRVGIGTQNPGRNLDVITTDTTTYSAADFESLALSLRLINSSSTTNSVVGIQMTVGGNSDAMVGTVRTGNGEGALVFGTRSSGSRLERMRISPEGRVTKPYQPAFLARYSGTGGNNFSGNIVYPTSVFNVGGHYSTSTGRFTAPVAGVYLFYVQYIPGNDTPDVNNPLRISFYKNGSSWPIGGNNSQMRHAVAGHSGYIALAIDLAVNDYVLVHVHAKNISDDSAYQLFGGYLLG